MATIFESTNTIDADILTTRRSITLLFSQCRNKIQKLATCGNDDHDQHETQKKNLAYHERLMRFNMMKSKAAKVQELTIKFRNVERDFSSDLKRQERLDNRFCKEKSQNKLSGGAGTLSQWDMICNNNMTQEQLDMLENHVNSTNIRRQEIVNVAKSVNELAQLFNE